MLTTEDTPETSLVQEAAKRGRGRPRKYPEHSIEALLADEDGVEAEEETGEETGEAAYSGLASGLADLQADRHPQADWCPQADLPGEAPMPPEHKESPAHKEFPASDSPCAVKTSENIAPVRRPLAYRPDGLPMGEIDPKAYGPNGLLWGRRDPCDILSLDQATGWFEWDETRWGQWKAIAHAGLADAMLERAHILHRKRRGQAEKTLEERQWDVVCLLARLVQGYVLDGMQTQYADPHYDASLLRSSGSMLPSQMRDAGLDTKKFPFRSGTRVQTQFNPYREIRVAP